MKIGIIGAGLSGLVLANNLNDKWDITLFEKARGVGGRMATRHADPYQFDHGAQFFTARQKEFKKFLQPLLDNGLVVEWNPIMTTLAKGEKPYKRDWFEPHYIPVPKMNSMCKYLARDQDIYIQ
jgi:renalase